MMLHDVNDVEWLCYSGAAAAAAPPCKRVSVCVGGEIEEGGVWSGDVGGCGGRACIRWELQRCSAMTPQSTVVFKRCRVSGKEEEGGGKDLLLCGKKVSFSFFIRLFLATAIQGCLLCRKKKTKMKMAENWRTYSRVLYLRI
jgi:hypothetical protein